LRCGLRHFGFKLIELLLHDFFVIRKVGFQPLEGAGVIFGLEVALKFVQLLVAHLISQADADAHLKRTIMGREVVVAITAGRLDLGPWEQIFYGEFDGKRRKRALVKIIGE